MNREEELDKVLMLRNKTVSDINILLDTFRKEVSGFVKYDIDIVTISKELSAGRSVVVKHECDIKIIL